MIIAYGVVCSLPRHLGILKKKITTSKDELIKEV
jgi:hypothetical protein